MRHFRSDPTSRRHTCHLYRWHYRGSGCRGRGIWRVASHRTTLLKAAPLPKTASCKRPCCRPTGEHGEPGGRPNPGGRTRLLKAGLGHASRGGGIAQGEFGVQGGTEDKRSLDRQRTSPPSTTQAAPKDDPWQAAYVRFETPP